jgi:error-prone DNA polymerase
MGFYAPAQLVRDACEHDVELRPPDVNASHWDNVLEINGSPRHAVRLGFRQITGFRAADAELLVAARGRGFDGVRHLEQAAKLSSEALTKLAEADAFRSLGLDRRQALWAVKGLDGGAENARLALPELPLFARADAEELRREEAVQLTPMLLGEHVVEDYRSLRLSLKAHPLSQLRTRLKARRVTPNGTLETIKDGAPVRVAGLVLVRQRPGTAKGVIFATLEDETGVANIIVWSHVFERFRRIVLGARLLEVRGRLQKQGLVIHVVADEMSDLSAELSQLSMGGAESCGSVARADGVKHSAPPDVQPHRHPRNVSVMPKSRDFR